VRNARCGLEIITTINNVIVVIVITNSISVCLRSLSYSLSLSLCVSVSLCPSASSWRTMFTLYCYSVRWNLHY